MAEDAAALKQEGNKNFTSQKYAAAVDAYTRCLDLDPKQHLVLSNRSAAYLKLGGSSELALKDAEECVRLEPSFAKGYSRQAAALQQLKRWEEAVKVCEQGLKLVPDDEPLKAMSNEVRNRHLQDRIQGAWHGRVKEELGDYEQEMEFLEGGRLRVEVMGRSVDGHYQVDCSKDPVQMDITVDMRPMPYIVKLDPSGLHLCCPFAALDRPTQFEGPGYCLMLKGKLPTENFEAELGKLSSDEKMLLCVGEITEALPTRKLEEPMPTDSEDTIKAKMMVQVKFEGAMFRVQQKFGEEFVKDVLNYAKGEGRIPAVLAKSKELKGMREALCVCGLLEEMPDNGAPPAPSPPPAPAAPKAPAAPSEPKSEKKASASASKPAPEKKAAPAADSSQLNVAIAATLAVSALAVAGGWFFWQRRRR